MRRYYLFFLLAIAMVIPFSEATPPSVYFPPGTFFLKTYECRFATPFPLIVEGFLGFASDSLTYDITLSSGIQLLNGNLHWCGKTDKHDTLLNRVIIRIDQPGIYSTSIVFDAKNVRDTGVDNWPLELKFPVRDKRYFYVTGDTIAVFIDSLEMMQRARDSLILSYEDLHRRVMKRFASLENVRHAELGLVVGYWGTHPKCLLDTSINELNLQRNTTNNQYHLIQNHWLLFQPLRKDCDSLVKRDTIVAEAYMNRTSKLKLQIANLGLVHIRELYALDQQILKTNLSEYDWPYLSEKNQLLAKRRELLKKQIAQMDSLGYSSR